VAAATLTVVAAVEDESGNLKIVGLPAEAGLDGSFTLRVPAKDGQRIYVLPNVNATYWKATTQLAGVISLTAAIGRTIEDVHIGLAPRNGVEFAVNIILDSVRDKYPGQGASSLLAYLDQSESAVLQGVPETVPARIATWKASLQQTTLLAETTRGNLNKLRLTTFRSSELQSLGRVRHANAIGPLSLTRDVAKTDSVATRAHLARDPSVAELDAPISNLADESAVFDSEAPSSETREGSTPERRRKKSAEDGAPFDEPFTSSPGVTASNASREVEERSDDKKTHMPVQKPEAASSREGEEQSPAT
jgi:hypothetical protein